MRLPVVIVPTECSAVPPLASRSRRPTRALPGRITRMGSQALAAGAIDPPPDWSMISAIVASDAAATGFPQHFAAAAFPARQIDRRRGERRFRDRRFLN